jgi:hypothetical protein
MEQTEDRIDGKPFGVPLTIRGLNMVVFLALVAITSFTIYYLSVVVSAEHGLISLRIGLQTEAMERQTEVLAEQNYILLADEAETTEIKKRYRMPKSLREKMNDQWGGSK